MKKLDLELTKVNVATLKNDLSKYLRMIKAGKEVIVLEHKTPIAKVVPIEKEDDLVVITAKVDSRVLKEMVDAPAKTRQWDSLDYLLNDRKKR